MPAAIQVQDLTVVRGDRQVLPGISLEVPSGQITGLLGPSGSGKTTLMRAIVGVQVISSGSVTVLGKPAGAPELRRRVGYVTQAPSVYADLTVRENLEYFSSVVGASPELASKTLATVQLDKRADQVAASLSGGERARVSLATALLSEPDLLVLDEPTVGLDPRLREDLWESFQELAVEGKTLLVSSHVMDEADRCESLLLVRDGRLVATGSPAELRRRTGAPDVGRAFLRVIEREEAAA